MLWNKTQTLGRMAWTEFRCNNIKNGFGGSLWHAQLAEVWPHPKLASRHRAQAKLTLASACGQQSWTAGQIGTADPPKRAKDLVPKYPPNHLLAPHVPQRPASLLTSFQASLGQSLSHPNAITAGGLLHDGMVRYAQPLTVSLRCVLNSIGISYQTKL